MFDSPPEPISPRFTAVILTALETEYKAVRDLLVEAKVVVGASGRDYRGPRSSYWEDGALRRSGRFVRNRRRSGSFCWRSMMASAR